MIGAGAGADEANSSRGVRNNANFVGKKAVEMVKKRQLLSMVALIGLVCLIISRYFIIELVMHPNLEKRSMWQAYAALAAVVVAATPFHFIGMYVHRQHVDFVSKVLGASLEVSLWVSGLFAHVIAHMIDYESLHGRYRCRFGVLLFDVGLVATVLMISWMFGKYDIVDMYNVNNAMMNASVWRHAVALGRTKHLASLEDLTEGDPKESAATPLVHFPAGIGSKLFYY